MVLTETHLPVLGICAGHQLINISLGGTLVQDIESEIAESAMVSVRSSTW
jgi:gamma-glutamyl-gamma-aminobutyrate hydrolase PuuD